MPQCPNKQHPDWKAIEDLYGTDAAYLAYVKNGEDIPSVTGAKYLLGINEDGEVASHQTQQLMMGLTGFTNPGVAQAAIDHLLDSYSNVRFFSSEEEFKRYVRTNFLRDVEVTAEDIGLAFKNAVFIRPGEHRQDRMLHELGHIYYDSLADDNRSKVELRKLFTGDGSRPIDEIDEDIVRAIGQMAHEHADQFFSPTFYGKLVNALRRFWVQVKLTIGAYSQRDLLFDMADQLYNNRERIGSELFGSDVLRHLLVPSTGNVVGMDFDNAGRHTAITNRKLSSPTSIIKAFFGQPDMDTIEGMQEEQLLNSIRRSFIGDAGGRAQDSEIRMKTFMRHHYYGMQDKLGTAIHAVMAKQFIDSTTATPDRIAEVDDAYDKARALLGEKLDMVVRVANQTKDMLIQRYGDKVKFHPELTLASSSKGLFGRLDLVVELPNGNYVVVDFKTVNKSLFGKNGFAEDYVKVHGIGRLPFMQEIGDTVSKAQLHKLYKGLSSLPNSKFRQHQLQGMVYRLLVEDQLTEKGVNATVEEVIFVPIIKDMEPIVVPKEIGRDSNDEPVYDIDRDSSRWDIGNLTLDKKVVVTYNRKLNGPSVPQTSSPQRERLIQDQMEMVLKQVKVVQLSNHSSVIGESIRRASMRAGAVDVKMAYDAVDYVTMASGKPLNELRSRDLQQLFNTGLSGMYERAMLFIINEAKKAKVDLPESFMNHLNHEQIYWAAKHEFIPDFSDVQGGSLRRTKNHSDPAMRFVEVEIDRKSVWKDNTAKKGFDHKLHSSKKVHLTLNGGAQDVVFKEYGLTEASKSGKLKVGMTIMLPPVLTAKEGKENGLDHTVRFGKIAKVYDGAISVEVEEDGGGITKYYIKDKDTTKDPDSVNVHATDDYGIYVVESAKGLSFNENADSIDSIRAERHTMDSWTPSFTEEQQPVMGHHFVKRSHFSDDGEVLHTHASSYKGLWQIFELMPSNRDMIRMYDDIADDYNKPLKDGLSDLEYMLHIVSQRSKLIADSPANEMVNAIHEAYFCHVLSSEVRTEALELSNHLPKYTMMLHNIARNVAEGREKFSAEKLGGFLTDTIGAQLKMPRLMPAQQFGINIFTGLVADAYNEAQSSINSNVMVYNSLVKAAQDKGYDLKELMYQRPSSKYQRTRPYVFRSTKDEQLSTKPELLAILNFLEGFYRNNIPRFSTIGGTLVPLADMGTKEVGQRYSRSWFWRDRFVHLFSSKPWDSEMVRFDPESGMVNGKNAQLRPLKEWKRHFLEQHTIPDMVENKVIGTFFQHLAFRWTSFGTKSFSAFSTSKMHQLDREAREQYESKYGNRKSNVDRHAALRRLSVRRSGNSQSLIPTQNVEISLRASIRDTINSSLMSKVTPVASYLYDEFMPKDEREKDTVAADFVFNYMFNMYPGMRQKDDSPIARMLRISTWLMSLKYLGIKVAPQAFNIEVGQANNFFTSPDKFGGGWSIMTKSILSSDPGKVFRMMKYYKVIDITEDFVFDEESNTFIDKATKLSMTPMQWAENINHLPLVLGFIGRRAFENLDSSMTNEVNRNGKDTGKPKRGLMYRVNISDDKKDTIKRILIANGLPADEVSRTVELGFVWCAPIDLRAIASTMGSTVEELKDGALTKDNDTDLPSKADIAYILGRVIGQTHGDYRKPLRNAFSHTTFGSATMVFRKFMVSIYSATLMSSRRDSHFEMITTIRDKLFADLWYYCSYGASPYYWELENGNRVKKRIGSKQERRIRYIRDAVDQMIRYNLQNSKDFGEIDMDSKRSFKGRQLATVMILNKLKNMIAESESGNLSFEKLVRGELDDSGRDELDRLIVKLAKSKGRSGDLFTNRSNIIIITNLINLMIYLLLARPDDDETDSKDRVMVTQMDWYKRWLYAFSMSVFNGGIAPYVLPSKIGNTFSPSPLVGYFKNMAKGAYDRPYHFTLLENIASTPEGQQRADVADRVLSNTPFVSGLYDNAQLLYDTFTGNNWKAKTDYEKAQMGRKLIMMETQQAYIRLREQDPERFKRIMEAQGYAKAKQDEAMAIIWNRINGNGNVDLDQFEYDMATENRDQVLDAYENELKNLNNKE